MIVPQDNGVLTLSSGNPFPTADLTGGTIYWCPWQSGDTGLYVYGIGWDDYSLQQLSVALFNLTAGSLYDVFMADVGLQACVRSSTVSGDTGTAGGPNNFTVALPSQVLLGDLIVIVLSCVTPGLNIPTGWFAFTGSPFQSGSHVPQTNVLYKAADGTEGGTTLSLTNAAGSNAPWVASVVVIAGGGSIESIMVGTNGTGLSLVAPSITPTLSTGQILLSAYVANPGTHTDFISVPSNQSGLTYYQANGTPNAVTMSVGYECLPSNASTSTRTGTITSVPTAGYGINMVIAPVGTTSVQLIVGPSWVNANTRAFVLGSQDGTPVLQGNAGMRYEGSFCASSAITTEDSYVDNRFLFAYTAPFIKPSLNSTKQLMTFAGLVNAF